MNLEIIWKKIQDFVLHYGVKVLIGIAVFLVGWMVIRLLISRLIGPLLKRSRIDPTLHAFIKSGVKILLFVILIIICLSSLGLDTSSLIAALSVVGLAVSLAVKDSLANIAGGILMLFSKPFVLGDFVDIGANSGTVAEIGLIYTVLTTVDNKKIFIPNGDVSKSQITNYSSEPIRRLDLTFSIGYEDDFQKAKAIISKILEEHPAALDLPEPLVRMGGHGESSIDLLCRVWAKSEDFWDLKFDLLEQVKVAFDREGINIPYKQLDVHIHPSVQD